MNARTRLQLRLQTTVEGLSVAAITYYVVGLFGYLVKAAHDSGRMTIEPSIVTAAFVPIAAFAIWWTVRQHPQEAHRGRGLIDEFAARGRHRGRSCDRDRAF